MKSFTSLVLPVVPLPHRHYLLLTALHSYCTCFSCRPCVSMFCSCTTLLCWRQVVPLRRHIDAQQAIARTIHITSSTSAPCASPASHHNTAVMSPEAAKSGGDALCATLPFGRFSLIVSLCLRCLGCLRITGERSALSEYLFFLCRLLG